MSINLENFEVTDCEFGRASPFVLTSPTSLDACFQLGIEPIELVYRSLEHFEETCCHLPLSQIYRIYEEAETNRQAKLLQCREQRKALLYDRDKLTITKRHGSSNNREIISPRSRSSSSTTSTVPIKERNQPHQQQQQNNNNPKMKKTKSASATSVKVNFTRNDLSSQSASTTRRSRKSQRESTARSTSRGGSTRNLLRGSSSSGSVYLVQKKRSTSDTESNEGTLHLIPVSSAVSDNNCNNCGNHRIPSSKSVPDLTRRGNLDFSRSPKSMRRHYCLCHLDLRDQDILSDYFKRYDDVLSVPSMSEEDRKIMERLILKRAKMQEWEKQSQDLREIIELDRMKRYKDSQLLAQQWQDKLTEKRRRENLENHMRFLKIKEKLDRQQKDLQRYLHERDQRVQNYLEELSFKKKQGMLEKQKLEALRQLEVSRAIETLLQQDKQRRQDMRLNLEKRMTEAEIRKRRREKDYWRHVSDMNRLEDIKRGLKIERIDQIARASAEELRQQIEEKEHRAKLNQLRNLQLRDQLIESGAGRHQKQIEKARKLHEDLLRGFEEWTKRAYELHLTAQERAGLKHVEEINRRRARAASERILREERTVEMIRRKHEMEEQRKELVKSVIETKNLKTARVKAEKQHAINVSRIRAQHASELRQRLIQKLNPETFDKKAARAEIELRVLRKSANSDGAFGVKFNPRLAVGRRCSCKGRLNSFKNSCSGNGGNNNNNSKSYYVGFYGNNKGKKKDQNSSNL